MTGPTLIALLDELIDKSSEIKNHICVKTKKQSLNDVNIKEDICSKKSITKEYLAETVLNVIIMIDKIDSYIKPNTDFNVLNPVDINASNQLYSDVQKQFEHCSKVVEDANKAISDQKANFEQQISELNTIVSRLLVSNPPPESVLAPPPRLLVPEDPVSNVVDNLITENESNNLCEYLSKID